MAGKYTGTQRTYVLEDSEIKRYTGVTYGSTEGYCKTPVADNAIFLGVVDNDERINDPLRAGGNQAGRNVAVHIDGYGEIRISGNVNYGDMLILGSGGVAKKVPSTPGQYNVIGFAEKSGVDGEIIPFKIQPFSYTVA